MAHRSEAGVNDDSLIETKKKWQQYLDEHDFRFSKEPIGMIASINNFSAPCQLHIIYDPARQQRITFKLVRNGNEILALEGDLGTVFRTLNNNLYFAHFGSTQPGCTVVAYDLSTGNRLWKSVELSRLGSVGHSAYGNQVNMSLSSDGQVAGEGQGAAIIILGRESYGDYAAVLDRKTGVLLAHKIYRKGFAAPNWPKPKRNP
jgi:hypothetical protein